MTEPYDDGPMFINGVTVNWEPDEWDTINANEADDYRHEVDDDWLEAAYDDTFGPGAL